MLKMNGAVHLKLIALAVAVSCIRCQVSATAAASKQSKLPVDRSYQLSPVAVVNGAQGIQYYATAPVYSGVPGVQAFVMPGQPQIGVESLGLHPGNGPQVTNMLPSQHDYYYGSSSSNQPNNFHHILGLTAQPQSSQFEPPPQSQVSHFESPSQPQISQYDSSPQPPHPTHLPHSPHSHYSLHKPRTRSHYLSHHSHKRYGPHVNSLHGFSSGPKQTVGLSGYQDHKTSPSFLVQPSIDLTDLHQQSPSTNSYLSTVSPLSVSTYGPPKPVEVQYKRPPGGPSNSHMHHLYHRHKGHGHVHRHPYWPPKTMRLYSHMHSGHIHNHFLPPGYSTPLYKSQHYSPKPTASSYRPGGPTYLPPGPTSTPDTPFSEDHSYKPEPQDSNSDAPYNYHAQPRPESSNSNSLTSNQVRFPEKPSIDGSQPSKTSYSSQSEGLTFVGPTPGHNGLTQAIIGETGVINNHDASLPLKIPSQKPNHFQVTEILKNSDIHYVDADKGPRYTLQPVQYTPQYQNPPPPQVQYTHALQYQTPQQPQPVQYQTLQQPQPVQYQTPQQPQPVQYSHELQYQNSQVFDPSQPTYQAVSVEQTNPDNAQPNAQVTSNQLDLYDPRENTADFAGSSGYHNNHVQTEQELGTSDTVKIPVAIFKGIHDTNGQGMFAIAVKRSDQEVSETGFTPSRVTSDWVPMTAGKLTSPIVSETSTKDQLEHFGDDYFAALHKKAEPKPFSQSPKPSRVITSNQKIGDIISGKIPGEFSPFRKPTNEKRLNIRTINLKGGKDSDVVTGKISFGGSQASDRRKGSVLDDYPSSPNTEGGNFSDTSNLVVSSVIKFS